MDMLDKHSGAPTVPFSKTELKSFLEFKKQFFSLTWSRIHGGMLLTLTLVPIPNCWKGKLQPSDLLNRRMVEKDRLMCRWTTFLQKEQMDIWKGGREKTFGWQRPTPFVGHRKTKKGGKVPQKMSFAGLHKSLDALQSWADPGSCSTSAYVKIFSTIAINPVK